MDLITDKHLDEACKKCAIPASRRARVLPCLNTGMHRLFDDIQAYCHYSIGTGIDAGKWFLSSTASCVAMDSQALDHPCTAMGNNGMTRMNLLGATGKPITEEYKELFGEEAMPSSTSSSIIRIHGQAIRLRREVRRAGDLAYGGTREACHKEMLGHGHRGR